MSAYHNLMSREDERKFLVECIRLYRDLPTLWNVKIKDYYVREKKNSAYEILLKKYRKMYPDATKEDVKKKLNSLRTNYRKELKKHVQYTECGKNNYTPTLWYYNEMKFLQDLENLSDTQCDNVETTEMQNITVHVDCDSFCDDDPQPSNTAQQIRKIKREIEDVEEPKKRRRQSTDYSEPSNPRYSTDYYQHWALASAADLQKMNPEQEILAKRAIAEILMQGRLGLLRRGSVKIKYGPEHMTSSSPSP